MLLLGVRKTKQLFLCLLLVAFIYLFYAHNFHTLKVIEISKINKNYAIISKEKVTDFIRVTSRQNGTMPQKTLGLSAEKTTVRFMTNRSDRTSIKNLSGENDRLTKGKRYKVKMSLANRVEENVGAFTRTNKELIAFATQRTEFMTKNTTDNFKLWKSPNYSTKPKEKNKRKPLLANTIPPNLFKQGLKHSNFGYLNVHIWYDVCEDKVESLREYILFPQVPSRRSKTNSFQTQESGNNFGLRIFGFLHPPTSGDYNFGISSNNNSELWLSVDERRENLRCIAFLGSKNETKYSGSGNYYKFSSQISKPVYLEQGEKYFVEVLCKHGVGKSHVEVAWISPGESSLKIISEKSISMFVDDTHLNDNIVSIDDYSEQGTSSLQKQVGFDPFFTIPFIDETKQADLILIQAADHRVGKRAIDGFDSLHPKLAG